MNTNDVVWERYTKDPLGDALERIAALERLVMSLGDKLLIVAQHLGRLSEKVEKRNAK